MFNSERMAIGLARGCRLEYRMPPFDTVGRLAQGPLNEMAELVGKPLVIRI